MLGRDLTCCFPERSCFSFPVSPFCSTDPAGQLAIVLRYTTMDSQAPEYEGLAVDALLAANKKYKKHHFFIVADEESMKSADRAVLVVWAEKGGKAGDPERGDSFRCAPSAVPAVEKKLEEEGKKAWAVLCEGVGGDGVYRG